MIYVVCTALYEFIFKNDFVLRGRQKFLDTRKSFLFKIWKFEELIKYAV